MGTGCVCNNTSINPALSRVRTVRLVGKGCKRTPVWETLSTKAQVQKKIEEFWETRIEGNPNVWKTLRKACEEPSPQNSEQIVKAAGISMLSGSLMLTFDENGYRYDLPVYVINEANRYGVEKPLPKLPEGFIGNDIKVVVRCGKFNDDTQVLVNTSEKIASLKQKFIQNRGIQDQTIKFFFNGKELKDEISVHHSGVKENFVVQALV